MEKTKRLPSPLQGVEAIVREFDSNKYYWFVCESCGFEDSSNHLEGCHAIADTGDHTDPVCPVCYSNKIEGDSKIENVPDSYSGVVKVLIPFEIHTQAFKKVIQQQNEELEKYRYPITPMPKVEGVEEAAVKIDAADILFKYAPELTATHEFPILQAMHEYAAQFQSQSKVGMEWMNSILTHQNEGRFHPLTCGKDSRHSNLIPAIDLDGVNILVCKDCDYVQKYIPTL